MGEWDQADHMGVATSCTTASQEDPTATGLARKTSGAKMTVTSPSQNRRKHHHESKTQALLPALRGHLQGTRARPGNSHRETALSRGHTGARHPQAPARMMCGRAWVGRQGPSTLGGQRGLRAGRCSRLNTVYT